MLYPTLTPLQGELEHRYLKRYYARTNKQNHAAQIAHHVFIADRLRKAVSQTPAAGPSSRPHHRARARRQRGLPTNPVDQFSLASSERNYEDITAWAAAYRDDPAFKVWHQ